MSLSVSSEFRNYQRVTHWLLWYVSISGCVKKEECVFEVSLHACVCVQHSCVRFWCEAGCCLLWKYYCKCLLLLQCETVGVLCVPCGLTGVCVCKCVCMNWECVSVCVCWVGVISPSLCLCLFCSHRPTLSPLPGPQCRLGNGEAYWSWLVLAGSQIEFWQAGETSSQRDPSPSEAQWGRQEKDFLNNCSSAQL